MSDKWGVWVVLRTCFFLATNFTYLGVSGASHLFFLATNCTNFH